MKRDIGLAFIGLLVILGLVWIGQGNEFFLYKVFAPKYAAVQRETFEQTKSYQSGTIQELRKYQLEYETAPNQAHKDALASMILHTAADFGEEKLPADLNTFVQKVKNPGVPELK